MNTTPRIELPRTSTASRFQAVMAAAAITLAMLSGIDTLASNDASSALTARTAVASQSA
jgi:hypothetical protein